MESKKPWKEFAPNGALTLSRTFYFWNFFGKTELMLPIFLTFGYI